MARITVKVSPRPVSVGRVVESAMADSAGGTVVFVGTVRNRSDGKRVTAMELEAAEELAAEDLARICRAAAKKGALSRISVVHRVGRLRVGDVIVVIAVSAPHRKEAFAACRYVIDELKKSTPIWKKEFGGKSARWVEGDVN